MLHLVREDGSLLTPGGVSVCVGEGDDRKLVFKDKRASSVFPSWRSPGNTRRETKPRIGTAGAAPPSSAFIGSSCTLEEEEPSLASCFRRKDARLSLVLVWKEASRCCVRRRTDPDLLSRFPGFISGGLKQVTRRSGGGGALCGCVVVPTTNLIRQNNSRFSVNWPLNPGHETPGGAE